MVDMQLQTIGEKIKKSLVKGAKKPYGNGIAKGQLNWVFPGEAAASGNGIVKEVDRPAVGWKSETSAQPPRVGADVVRAERAATLDVPRLIDVRTV